MPEGMDDFTAADQKDARHLKGVSSGESDAMPPEGGEGPAPDTPAEHLADASPAEGEGPVERPVGVVNEVEVTQSGRPQESFSRCSVTKMDEDNVDARHFQTGPEAGDVRHGFPAEHTSGVA